MYLNMLYSSFSIISALTQVNQRQMSLLQNAKTYRQSAINPLLTLLFLLCLLLPISACGDDEQVAEDTEHEDTEEPFPELPDFIRLNGDLSVSGIVAYGRPAVMAQVCLIRVDFCVRSDRTGRYQMVRVPDPAGWMSADFLTETGPTQFVSYYNLDHPANDGQTQHINPSTDLLARMASEQLCPGSAPMDCTHPELSEKIEQLEQGLQALLAPLWPTGRSSQRGTYQADPVNDELDYLHELIRYDLDGSQLTIYWQNRPAPENLLRQISVEQLSRLTDDPISHATVSPLSNDEIAALQPPLPAKHQFDLVPLVTRMPVQASFAPGVGPLTAPPLQTEVQWLFTPDRPDVTEVEIELLVANGGQSRWRQLKGSPYTLWLLAPGRYQWWLTAYDADDNVAGYSWGEFYLGWDDSSPLPPSFGAEGSCVYNSVSQLNFQHCLESQDGTGLGTQRLSLAKICTPSHNWRLQQGYCPTTSGLQGQPLLGRCTLDDNQGLLYYYPDTRRQYLVPAYLMAEQDCLSRGQWQAP